MWITRSASPFFIRLELFLFVQRPFVERGQAFGGLGVGRCAGLERYELRGGVAVAHGFRGWR